MIALALFLKISSISEQKNSNCEFGFLYSIGNHRPKSSK